MWGMGDAPPHRRPARGGRRTDPHPKQPSSITPAGGGRGGRKECTAVVETGVGSVVGLEVMEGVTVGMEVMEGVMVAMVVEVVMEEEVDTKILSVGTGFSPRLLFTLFRFIKMD